MHKVLGVLSVLVSLIGLVSQLMDTGPSSYDYNSLSLGHLKPQYKYWMLEGYMDSILENKSIVKHSFDPLVLDAILLRIEEDSFYTAGTLNSARTLKKSVNMLGTLEGSGKFQFVTEIMGNRILAISSNDADDLKRYVYTPITEEKYWALSQPNDSVSGSNPLQEGINKMLVERLFAGEYQPLKRQASNLVLNEDGSLAGFKNFRKFRVHDYFGTSHPFEGLDVVWFESANGKGNYYNWKFASDTLILTEMLTKDKETYFPGKRSFSFLKI